MPQKNASRPTKFHIRRGDRVRLLTGNDKGKEGKVLQVYPSRNQATVEGCRLVKRHRKPDRDHPNGQIEEKTAPIQISNLMLIDPSTGKPTRIGRKLNDQKKLQRYAKKTGEFIQSSS